MAKRLDVIIFGATGFTGKYCVLEAVKVLQGFTWGIAGRNKNKLEKVLQEIGKEAHVDLSKTPIVIADVDNEKSLQSMAQQAKVIVNCCGPYRFFGEQVVKACINAGTHHVDVSGEQQFIERMQLEYHDLAKQNGSYIISTCGFDSIPADLGTVYVEKNFDGVVNSVECYLESKVEGNPLGTSIHYGTWNSLIHAVANWNELRKIRSKLFTKQLPSTTPKLRTKISICKSPIIDAYLLPFPGVDQPVVERSQRYFYETENKRPIQMKAYLGLKSFLAVIGVMFALGFVGIFSQFSLTRYLLLRFPRIFTLGFISHEGPSQEKMKNTKFSFTFYAEGWSKEDQLSESTDKYTIPPNKKLIARITGYNPGYGATNVGLLVAATTILKEKDKLPNNGGVYTPAGAFAKTNIITELNKYDSGFHFEIVKSS